MRRATIKAAATLAAVSVLAAACSAAPAPKAASSKSHATPVVTRKTPSATQNTTGGATQGTAKGAGTSKNPVGTVVPGNGTQVPSGTPSNQPGVYSAKGVAPAYSGPVTNPAQALASQGLPGSFPAFPASNPAVAKFGQGPVDAAVAEMIKFSVLTTCNNSFVQLVHPTALDASFLQPYLDANTWNYLLPAFTNPALSNRVYLLATFNQNAAATLRSPYCIKPGVAHINVSVGNPLSNGVPVLTVYMQPSAIAVTGTTAKPTTSSINKTMDYGLVANPGGGSSYPWQINSWSAKVTTGKFVPDKYLSQE